MDPESNRHTQSAEQPGLESNARGPESKPGSLYGELLALSRVSAAVSGLRDLDAILKVKRSPTGCIGVSRTSMLKRCASNWARESQAG
jgi:hypothetical protein